MSLSNIDSLNNNPLLGDYQVTYHNLIHTGLKALKTQTQSTDSAAMKKSGNQTIAGTKTFNAPPVIPGVEWISYPNSRFELDDGWAISTGVREYDATTSHSGSRSLKMTATGGIVDATSSAQIAVLPGQVYYGEVWVKWSDLVFGSGTAISFAATVTRSGGGSNSYPSFWNLSAGAIPVTQDEWIKLSGTLSVPNDSDVEFMQIRPSVRNGATSGSIWFDDVRIALVHPTSSNTAVSVGHADVWLDGYESLVVPGVEVPLSNGDFETSSSWTTSSNRTYDDTRSFEGTRSYKIVSSGTGADIAEVSSGDYIAVTPGEQYYAECYAWWEGIDQPSGTGISLQANITNSGGTQIAVLHFKAVPRVEAIIDSAGWVKLFGTITMPANAAFLRTRLSIREGAIAGTVWFDRVRVRKLTNETSLYYRGDKTWQTLNKNVAGLSNVDNTSDLGKPISTAQQTALNTKQGSITAGTTSQYYRGDKTWATLNKASVALSSADNTSDANKPISTAQQTALDAKQSAITAGETFQYYRGDKTWQTLNGSSVGLGNVNNTSDANKPISTATQTALDLKATTSETLLLSGNQEISGIKTFSTSPRLTSSSTAGYVWKATSTDGSASWQAIGSVVTTVDWGNIVSLPATFPPTIGAGSDQAAAGNHTHSKADIGLGNADNTSDANKPVSTAMNSALSTKVNTSRNINTSSHFDNMGNLSANRTLAIATGGIGVSDLNTDGRKIQIAYIQTFDTREVGYGQVDGLVLQENITITSVAYRMGTADASGTTTCWLRKNGSSVSGTSGTASTSPTAVTGSWSFVAGDILTVYISAVGTTPGKRLTADILALKT